MALFEIKKDNKVEIVKRREFKSEKELHDFIEDNIEKIIGIKLIAGEYPIPNGRIDSLGLDDDGLPVIIEYKWKKDLSAIIQGLFYLDWVMQNKKPFESIARDKLGKDTIINWSEQPRLIIIAQDFDKKELTAVNQIIPAIELKKYSAHDNLFNIEDVNIVKGKKIPMSGTKVIRKDEPDLEELVNKSDVSIREIFWIIRDKILGISESVQEYVRVSDCDYRTTSTFVSIKIQKKRLWILIKMGNSKCVDPKKITKPIPKNWSYGLLNTQFFVTEKGQIDYAMDLINQAYSFVSG